MIRVANARLNPKLVHAVMGNNQSLFAPDSSARFTFLPDIILRIVPVDQVNTV